MSQINRVPKGLQDLLASQNFGANPSDLGQVVAPTLDMYKFYAAERREFLIDAGTQTVSVSTSGGSIQQRVVPDGEIWIVDQVGITTARLGTPAAGDHATFTTFITNVVGSDVPSVQHPLANLGTISTPSAVGVAVQTLAYDFPTPLVMVGGDTVQWWIVNVVVGAGGSWNTRSSIRFVRLRV